MLGVCRGCSPDGSFRTDARKNRHLIAGAASASTTTPPIDPPRRESPSHTPPPIRISHVSRCITCRPAAVDFLRASRGRAQCVDDVGSRWGGKGQGGPGGIESIRGTLQGYKLGELGGGECCCVGEQRGQRDNGTCGQGGWTRTRLVARVVAGCENEQMGGASLGRREWTGGRVWGGQWHVCEVVSHASQPGQCQQIGKRPQ